MQHNTYKEKKNGRIISRRNREIIRWLGHRTERFIDPRGDSCNVVPPAAGIGVAIVIAWLVLLGGIAHLAIAWHIRSTGGMVWELLVGLLYLAIAIYMLRLADRRPRLAYAPSRSLPFGKGILVLILAFRIRHHSGSGWLFFDGVIALILGAMIGLSWPGAANGPSAP